MSVMQFFFLAAVFLLVVASVLGGAALLRPDLVQRRLRQLDPSQSGPTASQPAAGWLQWLADKTHSIGRLAAPKEEGDRSALKLRFMHAGLRHPALVPAYFGVKALLTLALPLLGYAAAVALERLPEADRLLLMLLACAAIGYYAPNLVLAQRVRLRQREIFEAFPDALDLMTVCMEAGLGTESALARVADDLALKSPPLGDELRLVSLELRAGADREHALRNLAIRTGVDEVGGFVTMLSQAERFGTSIAASLRVQSDMLRTRRRQRAEEAAAKVGLKLLFPLVFCIFPALLVVLLGPAMVHVYRVLLPTMATGG